MSFEELESLAYTEPFFLVSDKFPDELEFSFWVGPSTETAARAFKKLQCRGGTLFVGETKNWRHNHGMTPHSVTRIMKTSTNIA